MDSIRHDFRGRCSCTSCSEMPIFRLDQISHQVTRWNVPWSSLIYLISRWPWTSLSQPCCQSSCDEDEHMQGNAIAANYNQVDSTWDVGKLQNGPKDLKGGITAPLRTVHECPIQCTPMSKGVLYQNYWCCSTLKNMRPMRAKQLL